MAIYKTCDQCKKEFKTYPCYEKRNREHRFCSKACEMEFRKYNNTRETWKGGHIGATTGYQYIRINGKDVGEHILVAEKKIGRRLKPDEVVHHVNGNKTDNRPENLQVMTNSEHVKLHHPKTKSLLPCRRCGKERLMHGRGLCGNCYKTVLKKGELQQWDFIITQNTTRKELS